MAVSRQTSGQASGAQVAWSGWASSAGGRQGRTLLVEKEWHELRAQPWKLEPMETGEPTLGAWNLAPKDNKGSTEKITQKMASRAFLCAKNPIISSNFPTNPRKKVLLSPCS